ncbi:hypothetical protein LPJ66_010812 [Kickxella alabastrina]|uniref:Uncharacterized protein n=1 Tax=Kickxella alabastrina TaxID=61397 RepID=A0ACC1HZW2_9FUNG|nr:hypothetical protein LPJ66_010812 [Kickxella alabastrina]
MTAELFDDLSRYRAQGMKWKAIYLMYPYYLSHKGLGSSYSRYVSRQDTSQRNDVEAVQWIKAERQWIKDIIWEHCHSINTKKLVVMVQREFPDKPLKNIKNMCSQLLAFAKRLTFCLSDMAKLKQLVGKHGEDWARIDSELGRFPGRAQFNWIKHGHIEYSEQWTDSELQKLRYCMDKGMDGTEASRYIGARLPRQYALGKNNEYKYEKWTSDGDRRLLLMSDTFKRSGGIDWDTISEALCRSVSSCRIRHQALQSIKEATALSEPQPSKPDNVTREVQQQQKQQLSPGEVDWARVSSATGLSELECLELSQFDEGKAGWKYDMDAFSWDMANRMSGFIESNYPKPLPANFRAVSNFMWIRIEDCIQMHGLLHRKFRWTGARIAQAKSLREQGLSFENIAKRLSPLVNRQSVRYTIVKSPNNLRSPPISEQAKQQITDLVDKYVDKYPVDQVRRMVREELQLNCSSSRQWLGGKFYHHPVYKARIASADIVEITNRITQGKVALKEVAAQLDVPANILRNAIGVRESDMHSSRWTLEEIEKLTAYVSSVSSGRFDWKCASNFVGTKSPIQCKKKRLYTPKACKI